MKKETKEIKLYLTREEKEILDERARAAKLSLSSYCRKMLENGTVYQLDAPPIQECAQELRECKNILKTLLVSIYESGEYQKEDLEIIQGAIDQVTEMERNLSGEFQAYAKAAIDLLSK